MASASPSPQGRRLEIAQEEYYASESKSYEAPRAEPESAFRSSQAQRTFQPYYSDTYSARTESAESTTTQSAKEDEAQTLDHKWLTVPLALLSVYVLIKAILALYFPPTLSTSSGAPPTKLPPTPTVQSSFEYHDFSFGRFIFNKSKSPSPSHIKRLATFFDGFCKDFSNLESNKISGCCFVTFTASMGKVFASICTIENGKVEPKVYEYDSRNKGEFFGALEAGLSLPSRTKRQVYIYGDKLPALEPEVDRVLSKLHLQAISRSKLVSKDFVSTISNIETLFARQFDWKNVSYINGIPSNSSDQKYQDLAFELDLLQESRNVIDQIPLSNGATTVLTKQALLNEIESGSNNLLVIVAHCVNNSIYIGSEKVTLDDIKKLSSKHNRSNPRAAIILGCNTAKFKQSKILKTSQSSFSELLVQGGFFDLVIAPTSEILNTEAESIVKSLQGMSFGDIKDSWSTKLQKGSLFNIANK